MARRGQASEYKYYEFAAVDRPLGARDLDALRALSTRAHITPTSFVNTYEWGSFKGDPRRLVERYFDAFLYLANWVDNNAAERALRRPVVTARTPTAPATRTPPVSPPASGPTSR